MILQDVPQSFKLFVLFQTLFHSQILKFSRVFDQSASGGFFFSLLDFKCPLWLVRRKQKIRFHNRELPCREEDQWKEKKNLKKSRQIAYNFSNTISEKTFAPLCTASWCFSFSSFTLCDESECRVFSLLWPQFLCQCYFFLYIVHRLQSFAR